MLRLLKNFLSILAGLLLAYYGLANTAATLEMAGAYAAERSLQQALEEQVVQAALSQAMEAKVVAERAALPARPAAPEYRRTPLDRSLPRPLGDAPPGSRSWMGELERATPETFVAETEPPDRTPVPTPNPETPLRLVIPAIGLDAPVVPAEIYYAELDGVEYQQWLAPNQFAAGWHSDSALLGAGGNTVLNGHNNVYGEVFRDLEDLAAGNLIQVYGQAHLYTYTITNHMILPEKYQQLDVRMNNAQWILPSQDERLTLITCWPYDSNTHRLIIVAKPLHIEELAQKLHE